MTPERWQQIEQLLNEALELEPSRRAAFLASACGTDQELRREVESLLAFTGQAKGFVETPPDDLAAEMLAASSERTMVGRTLGRYKLKSLLGAGGMGEVYRATDTRLRREVAVKILPEHLAQDAEALHRFEREARAVAALSHPNILAIHDFDNEQDVSFAVMELLEGETLRERLKRGPLDWHRAAEIGIAIAEGLAAAHAKGIIHRDLKPGNVFLTNDGGVKILDFGIARVKHTVEPDTKTATSTFLETTRPGTVMGTLGYMSPEQVSGEMVEAPSDIFSLGCVLYELVSGQRPFGRETASESIAAILRDEPPPLPALPGKPPAALERVIRHCLEKRPQNRYQTASELATDLKVILGGSGQEVSAPMPVRLRLRPAFWGMAVLAVAIIGLVVWLYLGSRRGGTIDSLAVLPLANGSGDAEAEYLSDGITESLINSLSQLPKLQVIARPTAFRYKGKDIDPRKVGEELNVRAVVTGRVLLRSEALSIQADLLNTANGTQLWGERYHRQPATLLTVQEEIARNIAEKLRQKLSGEEQRRLTRRYTDNTEAYDLYLRGRHIALNSWGADGFNKAIEQLNQAIKLDPTYALAHAGLAATYYDASGVFLEPQDAMNKAKAAALQALALDQNLAEAHTALGQVTALYEWKWAEGEWHYQRALELNPNFAPARLYYGIHLAQQGRLEEGIREMRHAQRLDPLTSFTNVALAFYHYVARRYNEAAAQCLKIIATDSRFYMAHSVLGLTHEQTGKFVEAITAFNEARRLEPEQHFTLGYQGHAYAVSGQRDEAQKMLAEIKRRAERAYVDPFAVAIIYVGLGDKDEAFAWLEKAYAARSESLLYYKDAPILGSLRSDPRFSDLLRRMNLAP